MPQFSTKSRRGQATHRYLLIQLRPLMQVHICMYKSPYTPMHLFDYYIHYKTINLLVNINA